MQAYPLFFLVRNNIKKMEHAVDFFGFLIQRTVEHPFQRIWGIYLNQNSLSKEGLIQDASPDSIAAAYRLATKSGHWELYRHIGTQLLTGFGMPFLQFFNALMCEELCSTTESRPMQTAFRFGSLMLTILVSYPLNMLQFRMLIDVNSRPENIIETIISVKEREGILGFYDGCIPTLIGAWIYRVTHALSCACLFPIMIPSHDTDGMYSLNALLAHYCATAISNVVVYPIDYLRRRMIIAKKARCSEPLTYKESTLCAKESMISSLFNRSMFHLLKDVCFKEGWTSLWDGCWMSMSLSTLKTGVFVLLGSMNNR
ncbi:ADP,ATP carrier protein [Perkinsela sp. CCAP 1560/4]|nr:ADP,ATP carrier protein [Perkinsela sp. CCAP 1560/4]|eukprot:KNH05151.1 ADP,ATP carrier protein [Perkinsela sp. CCAP 1560/4]